ncbi:MAG: class I SAM-dependent methyltransferase [Eubacteriales bacterium]
MRIFNITKIVQEYVSNSVKPGDCVIDATAGNGNDTCFLAERVGNHGQVYAFDILDEAISNTHANLQAKGLMERVKLIKDSHEKIDKYVGEPISCAMFNLGYLPKSTNNTVTKGLSTVAALNSCIHLLKKRGIITLCIYISHPGGKDEEKLLEEYVIALPKNKFKVLKYYTFNDAQAPYIYIIYRIK